MKYLFCFLAFSLLISCGSSVKLVSSQPPKTLLNKKIYMQLETSSGAISISDIGMSYGTISLSDKRMDYNQSNIANTSAMKGEKHVLISAKNMAFELRLLGLNLVTRKDQAEIIANLSIGTVRYDIFTGWIASIGGDIYMKEPESETIADEFYRFNDRLKLLLEQDWDIRSA